MKILQFQFELIISFLRKYEEEEEEENEKKSFNCLNGSFSFFKQ
jgi:hypothetical protein